MIDYPNKLDKIFDKLLISSIKPIIVGGYVRDSLLKIESKDIDIELYGISSFKKLEEILEEFGEVNSVGKSFGVCKLKFDDLDLDFSFPRIDSKIDRGHKGFEVTINPSLDFKTATSRRDFTINAIGYDIESKKILDPYKGREDLKNKVLKAVDIQKFTDDPLRVLRAIQFSARFNLSIDNELFITCKDMIKNSLLDELPKERIFLEIQKLLLKSPAPSLGIILLKKLGSLKLFIELLNLQETDFNQTLMAVDKMSTLKTTDETTNTVLMLALLSYKLSISSREKFLSQLTNSKSLIAKILILLNHLNSINFNKFIDYNIYILATQVNIEEFILFHKAISNSEKKLQSLDKLQERAKELGILNTKAEAILQGKDIIKLGLKPSKEFSKILDRAYRAQISGKFTTKKDGSIWLKKELLT